MVGAKRPWAQPHSALLGKGQSMGWFWWPGRILEQSVDDEGRLCCVVRGWGTSMWKGRKDRVGSRLSPHS